MKEATKKGKGLPGSTGPYWGLKVRPEFPEKAKAVVEKNQLVSVHVSSSESTSLPTQLPHRSPVLVESIFLPSHQPFPKRNLFISFICLSHSFEPEVNLEDLFCL